MDINIKLTNTNNSISKKILEVLSTIPDKSTIMKEVIDICREETEKNPLIKYIIPSIKRNVDKTDAANDTDFISYTIFVVVFSKELSYELIINNPMILSQKGEGSYSIIERREDDLLECVNTGTIINTFDLEELNRVKNYFFVYTNILVDSYMHLERTIDLDIINNFNRRAIWLQPFMKSSRIKDTGYDLHWHESIDGLLGFTMFIIIDDKEFWTWKFIDEFEIDDNGKMVSILDKT